MSDHEASWQADPTGRFEHRYWDGTQWTDHVSNAGVTSTDAFDAGPMDISGTGADDPTLTQPTGPADAPTAWDTPAGPPPPVHPGGPLPPSAAPAGRSNRGLLIGGAILGVVAIVVIALLLLGGGDDDTSNLAGGSGTTGTTSTTQGDTPETTDGGEIGSGSLPADFEAQIAKIYEDTLGLPHDEAECLAGKIADAVSAGDLTQDDAMGNVFQYLSDCGIELDEISGN